MLSRFWCASGAAYLVGACLLRQALGSFPNNTLQFSPLFDPGCGGDIVAVRSSPSNPDVIVMTGDMLGLTYSTDGGNSWLVTGALPNR